MGWVCRFCSTNNDDSDSQCIVCDKPKGKSWVCTLTAKRVRDLGLRGDVIIPIEFNVIGEDAFLNRTDITSVTLHDGVKIISKSAFSGCKNLRRVVSSIELESVGNKAFFDCISLRSENRPRAKKVAADAYGMTPARTTVSSPRTTYSPPRSSTSRKESLSWTPARVFASLILLGLSCIITVPLIVWLTASFGWTAWQWIIGLVGGLALVFNVIILAKVFAGSFEIYSFASVMTLVLMLINVLFLCIFKYNYLIISSIFSVIGAVGSGFIAHASFDERAPAWGKFDVALLISNVILFVVPLILFH